MVKGIVLRVNGTHYASSGKVPVAFRLLRSVLEDYRNDYLVIEVRPIVKSDLASLREKHVTSRSLPATMDDADPEGSEG